MRSMPYFSLELGRVIEQQGLKDVEIAKKAGLSPSSMSRTRSGKQARPNRETFEALAKAITDDPQVHGRLLAAYLKDLARGLPGEERISIRQTTHANRKSVAVSLSELPPSLERAFHVLIEECLTNREWAGIVMAFAEWLDKVRPPHKNA